MGQVTFAINGRSYRIGCADGEEDRLRLLARDVSQRVERLVMEFGQVGEARLLLMAALLASDALLDARADLDGLVAEAAEQLRRTTREAAEVSPGASGARTSDTAAPTPPAKASSTPKDGPAEGRDDPVAAAPEDHAAPHEAPPAAVDRSPHPGRSASQKPGRGQRIEIPGRVRSA